MELNTHAYDDYIASLFAPQDLALTESIEEMEHEKVRMMNVSATEGKLLHVLALAVGAKRILEVGTLGGYSGIHLARALPADGCLITLEIDPHHAEVARCNFDRAGIGHKVDIRVGPASETLRHLAAAGEAPFDLIFLDADKDGYTEYLRLSLPLLRTGGLLLGDNTLPDAVLSSEDSGTKRYNAAVAACAELTTVVVPVLRSRGLDGLTVSVKSTLSVKNAPASPIKNRDNDTPENMATALRTAIRHRRSMGLSRLKPDPVDQTLIEQMLDAANWAPSHGDTEPWRFTVFMGEGRAHLARLFAEAHGSDEARKRAFAAPVWISIGMEPGRKEDGSLLMTEEEEVMAVACAVQNLLLMASALGLAGMWHSKGSSVHPAVAHGLGLETPARLLGFFLCGWPATDWLKGTRRPLSEKVQWVTSR